MKTAYYNFIFAIALICNSFLALNVNAQDIKGIIVNEENNPINYAGIVLKCDSDSVCFARTYSDHNGNFILPLNDRMSYNHYFIQCMALGYETKTEHLTGTNTTVKIVLSKQPQQLSEIVVSGSRITKRPEGYVARLSNATITKGVNAGKTLTFLPGIVHDPTGYKLNGLPIGQFYINGRKASIEEVESIPGEMLRSAEVSFIDRFGVNKTGGVVNLILKAPDQGYYGNAYLQNSTRGTYHDKLRMGGILNYKIGNLEIYSNLIGVYASDNVRQNDDTDYLNGNYIHTKSKQKGWMAYLMPELNINYSITPEHRISGVFAGDFNHYNINIETENRSNNAENTFEGNNNGKENTSLAQGLFKYSFIPKNGKMDIELSGEFLNRKYEIDKQYTSAGITGNGYERRNKHTQIWEIITRSTQNWNEKLATDFTLVWNGVHEHNCTDIYLYSIGENNSKASIRNPFAMVGIYYNAGHISFASKLSYQGSFLTYRDRFREKKYTHKTSGLEPNIMLSYYFDKNRKNNLSLNYMRTITPFDYSLISTVKVWQDMYHYAIGNPNIKAPISNQVTLSTNINNDLFYAWIDYSVEKDPIAFATYYDTNQQNVSFTRPINGEEEHWWQIGVQSSLQIIKGWISKLNVNSTWGRQKGDFPSGKIAIWSKRWMFQWHNIVSLPKKWSVYNLFYCEPTYTTYNMDFLAIYGMQGSVSKIFSNKYEITLDYAFGKQRTVRTNLLNATQNYKNLTPVPYISLTFRWKFKGGKDVDVRRETTIQEYQELKAK